VSYDGNPEATRVIDLSRYIDHDAKTVKSVTGEINLNYGVGTCTLDSPKAQGACGFLANAGPVRLSDVAIRCENGYATVVLVVDGRSPARLLGESPGAGRDLGPPDGLVDPDRRVPGRGRQDEGARVRGRQERSPSLARRQYRGRARRPEPGPRKATLLDTAGYPLREVQGTRAGDDFSLKLPLNTMYLILE